MTRERTNCPQIVLDWIAWYPEDGLPPDVRSAIEWHASECAPCRLEIANLSGESAIGGEAAEGAERVFARALRRISGHRDRAAPASTPRRFWMVRPSFAVAAGVVVAVLSGTAGFVATQQLRQEPVYRPAAARVPRGHDVSGSHLDVVFRADAAFGEIADAMHAIGASVESGPTPSGVVHLRLAKGADAAAAAQRLESGDLRVAEFAQPAP